MTVFKTFFKIMKKNKFTIIFYIGLTVFFAGFNMKSNNNSTQFTESKPSVHIVNYDKGEIITDNLVEYVSKKSEIQDIENKETAIDDAIFYRQVDYVIYIPEGYGENFIAGKNPQIEIKQNGDYGSSLAKMILERYIKTANKELEKGGSVEEIIERINQALDKDVEVELRTKLDTTAMAKITYYFNFSNYSILAIGIYIICLILTIFKEEKVAKRTNIGAMKYKKVNRNVLFASIVFGIVEWLIFVVLGFILVGKPMLTANGAMLILNAFIFTMCTLCGALLIGNIVKNKNIVNFIVNIVALGSSFLCGSFVPVKMLPNFVVNIAHILPSYWFINANDLIGQTEEFCGEAMRNIGIDMAVMVGFCVVFIILTNIVSAKKRVS